MPLADVEAAWAYYLAHDNHGRGVVLVGHSQGTILLQSLIVKKLDGKPEQKLLVSAFLAGDPSLGVPAGAKVGGTFAHISTCSAAAQTGCVYVWGTYMEDAEESAPAVFGRARSDGMVSACANPAAPGGGSGMLKAYYPKPAMAPASDPPYLEVVGGLSGSCIAAKGANNFHVSVPAGPHHDEYLALLNKSRGLAGWGLHNQDMALV